MTNNIFWFKSLFTLKLVIASVFLLFLASSCRHHREVAEAKQGMDYDSRVVKDKAVAPVSDLSYLSESLGFKPPDDANLVLLWEITAWLGTPYRYGGKSKSGVDCSGFVLSIFRDVYNLELMRRSIDMAQNSRKIRDPGRLREGDLVFFRIRSRNISHVGIYLGEGRFVHASSSRGVIINNLNESYYSERFAFGGRVLR